MHKKKSHSRMRLLIIARFGLEKISNPQASTKTKPASSKYLDGGRTLDEDIYRVR